MDKEQTVIGSYKKEEEAMVLHFQNQVLREQDEELTDLSNHVTRTKHIAIAVGEELDLHTRLLDDFDDDVEEKDGRFRVQSFWVVLRAVLPFGWTRVLLFLFSE